MYWNRNRCFSPRATFGSQIDLFNQIFGDSANAANSPSFPAFNVWANEEGASVTSELPGVKLEELEITVSGNNIAIKGARKDGTGEGAKHARKERPAGEFNRTIELPFKIDTAKVEAKLANGVLEVSLPRAENDKPRRIAVNSN